MTTPTTTPGMGGLTLPAAREREAPLRMSAEEFRRVGHDLVDRIATFLAHVPDGPVTPAEPPATLQALLHGDRALPDEGTDPAALLAEASALLFEHSLLNGHPRFFGYITSSVLPVLSGKSRHSRISYVTVSSASSKGTLYPPCRSI